MKIIFTSAALIWSVVSLSQIIDSVKVIDYSQKKRIVTTWAKASFLELGVGGYAINSEFVNKKNGFIGQFSLIPVSIGASYLYGLGVGTKFVEYFVLRDNVEIGSVAPIYTYLPIYISKKNEREEAFEDKIVKYSIPSMVTLYFGGSLWCNDSDSSSSDTEIKLLQATKYIHVGINYMFYNYSFDSHLFGKGNFSLDSGILFYETKDVSFKSSFHIGLLYNFAASVKKYKEIKK